MPLQNLLHEGRSCACDIEVFKLLQISLPAAALVPFSGYEVRTKSIKRSLFTPTWESFHQGSGNQEIHENIEIGGGVLDQAVFPVSNRSSDDSAKVAVNLKIPAAQPGFIYVPADLSAEIVELNRTSPNCGFVVRQHQFNSTVPQDEEQNLSWFTSFVQV